MAQLVGRICTICRERIPSDLDGHFCQSCGNPVHEQCIQRKQEPMTCATCGTNLRAADDVQAKEEEAREANIRRSPPPPQLGIVKGVKWVQGGRFVLGGFIALCLGITLLVNALEEKHAEDRNVAPGVGAIIAGLGMMALGIWIVKHPGS